MKKITCLFLFFTTTLTFSQQFQGYSELISSGEAEVAVPNNSVTSMPASQNNALSVINIYSTFSVTNTYTDPTDFENDYNAGCSIPLISENFSGGPGDITTCGSLISGGNGGACFSAGELEDGFEITALGAGGNQVVFLPSGSFYGNSIDLVGAQTYVDYTIITFPGNDVRAVGQTIFNNDDTDVEYRIYDTAGDLLSTFSINVPYLTEIFFGFISDEPISRIELQGGADSGELIGNLQFGICGTPLVVSARKVIIISPNIETEKISVSIPSGIITNSVVLRDINGVDTGLTFAGGEIDISSLGAGTYFLTVDTDIAILNQTVIKL